MAVGAAWMVATRFAIRGLGILNTLILARLLLPEDFGLVAMASAFYGLIEVFSQFSFDLALIRDQQAGREAYDTAWTFGVLRGLATALVMVAGADAAADFFKDPRLAGVIMVMAGVAVIDALRNVGTVDFRKELDGRREFHFLLGGKLTAMVVTIVLAFTWRDYRALVAGLAAGSVASTLLSYVMHPYRPRLSLARWRELFHFSKWLVVHNVLVYFGEHADAFVISRMAGARALGLYTLAFDIANLVVTELIAPIRRIVFPGYAKLAREPEALARGFLDTFSLVAMAAVPLAAGFGLVADPMVRLFMGPNWVDAVPLIRILAAAGVIRALGASSGSVLLAIGPPRLFGVFSAINLAVLVPLLVWWSSAYGVQGAAWAIVVSSGVILVLHAGADIRLVRLPVWRVVGAVWRSLAAAGAMGAVVMAIEAEWPTDSGTALLAAQLAVEILAGALIYVGCHLTLWAACGRPLGAEAHALAAVRQIRNRRR